MVRLAGFESATLGLEVADDPYGLMSYRVISYCDYRAFPMWHGIFESC